MNFKRQTLKSQEIFIFQGLRIEVNGFRGVKVDCVYAFLDLSRNFSYSSYIQLINLVSLVSKTL